MPNREFYEVDVPIHDTANLARRGLHVFTGEADSPTTALRRAHEVYDAALAAYTAGLKIPGKQPDSWGARGLRTGWEMEWPAAQPGLWHKPLGWPAAATSCCRSARDRRHGVQPAACPGPIPPRTRREREIPSMASVLRVPARIGQRALLLTTAAVPLASWAVHAVALHKQLAATP